jgi:hypothetical protein
MKNTIKFFGNLNRARSAKVPLLIIAIVAVIGFLMAACDPGEKDDDSNDPIQHDETTVGRLTITGLSAFNGKYAFAQALQDLTPTHYAQESQNNDNINGLISNGSVTLKVWKVNSEGNLKSFNGNDSVKFDVLICHEAGYSFQVDDEYGTVSGTVQVTFANGIASGAFVRYLGE